MAELLIKMQMPKVCLTRDGWHGHCPMNRTWCAQRYAPDGYTDSMLYNDATDRIPEWCPFVELPAHGRLIDADELKKRFFLGDGVATIDMAELQRKVELVIDCMPSVIEASEESAERNGKEEADHNNKSKAGTAEE